MLGKYVLVEKRNRTDDMIGPSILISVKSVETKAGTVTAVDGDKITIDGNTYTIAKNLMFPSSYVNEFVLYHILDNGMVYVQNLKKKQGTLTYWNASKGEMRIDDNYQLGEGAESESVDFLGETKHTSIYVQFWYDNLHYIYKITNKVDKKSATVPNFYETYVPTTEAEAILWDDVQEWNQAYNDYIIAVNKALHTFSKTEVERREITINEEAKRMQKQDQNSKSRYLSGNLGSFSDYAYKALAEYFYDYTCNNIDLNSLDEAKIVNAVLKGICGATESYQYGNVKVTLNVTSVSASRFGSLMIEENGKKVVEAIVCSTQKEIKDSINHYIKELQDLATDSAVSVATSVYTDILGQSLSSLTEQFISRSIDKIEKRLAVKLSEKFNLSGVGNVVQGLNECYSYYNYVVKNMGNLDDIQAILGKVKSLEFKDTTIKDAAVKKAMGKLGKAKTQFVRSYEKYLAGTLENSNKGFFNMYINCPVDVEVYNSNGDLIGCASETELWYADSIEIVSLGGAKTITALENEPFSVKIISYGYGTMDCTVEELNGAHTPIGRLNYYNISLIPGKEYAMALDRNLKKNKDNITIETNGESIHADEYISVKEQAGVFVSCMVEADDGSEGGSIKGIGTYIKGNAVVLSAIPDNGYFFEGWYQGENLISMQRTYEFTAREDMVFTARFVHIPRIYVNVKAEGGGTVRGSDSKNDYLEGEIVTITAGPDEGKIFEGWYCDGKKISDDVVYQFTAVTDLVLAARFVTKELQDCVHIYDSGIVVKAPTVEKTGEKVFTCTLCGKKKSEIIPKLHRHNYVWTTIAQATVFEPEKQEGVCSGCGEKITKSNGSKLKATIKVNVTSIVLQKKQSTKKVKVIMARGDSVKSWKSNNRKIVTVDKNGVIKAQKRSGTAKITVTLKSGKKTTVKVKVQTAKVKTAKIGNLKSKLTVKKGKTVILEPIIVPFTSQEKISFISSNKNIATVNKKGIVRGRKKGIATITVKSGKIRKKIKITVK